MAYSVISTAFHKIVARVAVNIVVPTHHCPPDHPVLPKTSSRLKAAIPKKKSSYRESSILVQLKANQSIKKTYCRVIDCIHDPTPESLLIKELVLLSKHIDLWILVQQPSRCKLIKNTDGHGWQNGKKHIKTRHGPRFV